MKKYLFGIIALVCFSCTSLEKLAKKHPEDLAKICAREFPVVETEGPTTVVTKPAENVDYTGVIDSVNQEAAALVAKFKRESEGETDSVKKQCLQIMTDYQKDIDRLNTRVRSLQANYKPCKPDSVFTEKIVYRENTAKSSVLTTELAATRAKLALTEEQLDKWKGIAKQRFWWILALLLIIAAYVAGKLKKFF